MAADRRVGRRALCNARGDAHLSFSLAGRAITLPYLSAKIALRDAVRPANRVPTRAIHQGRLLGTCATKLPSQQGRAETARRDAREAVGRKGNAKSTDVSGTRAFSQSMRLEVPMATYCGDMDTLGIEPRAFRMRSGCDTITPCAHWDSSSTARGRLVMPTFAPRAAAM